MIPKLAVVCQRTGVSPQQANAAWLQAAPVPSERPWVKAVQVEGVNLVVGQGQNEEYFVCFRLPFEGHSDDWKVILPINKPEDLLEQLKPWKHQ